MLQVPAASFGSKKVLVELGLHRSVHRYGRVAAMFMDRSLATGLTTCLRRCVAALFVRHFQSVCVRVMYSWLRSGHSTNLRPRTSWHHWPRWVLRERL